MNATPAPAPGDVEARLADHKWVDVKGWGGALPGTLQCDRCYRVASPTDPKRKELLRSECRRREEWKP